MYAVIQLCGKQHKVSKGQVLTVDSLTEKEGSLIKVDDVLLLVDENKVLVGKSKIKNASVTLKVLGDKKGPKIYVERFKSKSKYHRKTGHRQKQTQVVVENINFPKS